MRTTQLLIERQERLRAGAAAGSSATAAAAAVVVRPQTAVPAGEWHFICECFWLTSTALHLGLFKVQVNSTTHEPHSLPA
jgi:hypothetical protein